MALQQDHTDIVKRSVERKMGAGGSLGRRLAGRLGRKPEC
jgi:hypothetical protein